MSKQALSKLTRGRIKSPTGTSYLTSGFLPTQEPNAPFSFGDFDYNPDGLCTTLSVECLVGLIQTEHAPLTKGWGDGRLADKEDVTVTVNGEPVVVEYVNPVSGQIRLIPNVLAGSDIEVQYHYTPNPTLPFAEFNNLAYTFNQYGTKALYAHKFPFNSVLSPEDMSTPKRLGQQYMGLQRRYSGVTNDPTTLLFNEHPHSPSVVGLSQIIEPLSLQWEGDIHPTSEGWEQFEGSLKPTQYENDLFVLDDNQSSQDLISGSGILFTKGLDLSWEHASFLNFRFLLSSFSPIRDFTGVCVGNVASGHLHFMGFLVHEGHIFSGLLADKGDESERRSYKGIPALVEQRTEGNQSYWDVLRIPFILDWNFDTKIFIEGSVYEVMSFSVQGNDTIIQIDDEIPSVANQVVQTFKVLKADELTSYRIFTNENGDTYTYLAGSASPLSYLPSFETPHRPEMFEYVGGDAIFFGSFSRQAESKSLWDFVRFDALPSLSRQNAPHVYVDTTFDVLPEQTQDWMLLDNQGSSFIQEIAPDHQVLRLEQGGRFNTGTYSYLRLEPLLSSTVSLDLQARLKVNSHFQGFPSTIYISDDEKDLVIGLFADDPADSDHDYGMSVVTLGHLYEPQSFSLLTGGFVTEMSQGNVVFRYNASYSGTTFFENEDWSVDNSLDLTFIDRYARVTKDHGFSNRTTAFVPIPTDFPFDQYLVTTRLRINEYDKDMIDNTLSIRFGVIDANIILSLAFYEDTNGNKKLAFVDGNNDIVLDTSSDIIGVDYEWDNNFHTYKIVRFDDTISLFVDNVFMKSWSILDFPLSSSNQETQDIFLEWTNPYINIDIDYIYSHTLQQGDRYIGIYNGNGSITDKSAYDLVPSPEWLGTFLDLQVLRNPNGKVALYLNQEVDPYIEVDYSELPPKQKRYDIPTDLGFIQFGSLDSKSLASTSWDYIRFALNNTRGMKLSLPHSTFNAAHSVYSGENIYRNTQQTITLPSRYNRTLSLSSFGIRARQVLSCKKDSLTIPFTFDFDGNEIHSDDIIKGDSIEVSYLTRIPYGHSYLSQQHSAKVIREDTPSFEITQTKTIQRLETLFEDIKPSDTFDLNFDYIVNDGSLTVTFSVDDSIYFDDLDLQVVDEGSNTDKGLIYPASDDLGLTDIAFSEFSDAWLLSAQLPEGLGNWKQTFVLDQIESQLDSMNHVMEREALNEAYAHLDWLRREGIQKPEDSITLAVITYLHGFILDKNTNLLDNINILLDTYSEDDETIDFQSPVNYP